MRKLNKVDVWAVSQTFADVLRSWMTEDEWNSMLKQNRIYASTNPNVCASHEYCDSNMALLDAVKQAGLGEVCEGNWGDDPERVDFLNDVWDHAKIHHLTAGR